MLLLGLLVLVLGVFGAVYLEENGPSPAPQLAATQPPPQGPVAPAPLAAPPPAATAPENPPPAQVVPPPESTPPQTAATPPVVPPAPPSPSASAPSLAQIAPTAAPANIAAAGPRYWVEFGAYEGSFYAERLKQKLGSLGIPATVTSAPGRHGRTYLRVRTATNSDREAALAFAAKAQTALQITPLLHRAMAISPGAARIAAPAPKGDHWVQFGAFRSRGSAAKVLDRLRKNGIQTFVIKTKNNKVAPLYLIRATGLPDRAAAAKVAQQGAAALHTKDVLIGESLRRQALHPRAPPR